MAAFDVTDEQRALHAAAQGFFSEVSSEAAVRAQLGEPAGFDRGAWQRAVHELGLAGLAVPVDLNGSGASWTDAAIVLEEAGRFLYGGPLLSSLMATAVLRECPGPRSDALLARLADGAVVALSWDGGCSVDDGLLSGTTRYVVDGSSAEVLLVLGADDMYAVDLDTAATREPQLAFDRTRKLAVVTLEQSPAVVLDGDLRRAHDLLDVLQAAELLGSAQQALDLAVAYAKERVQFGRAIGSFQAIKHLLADLLLEVESARSAVYYAAAAADEGSDELERVAPLARAYTADVLLQAASDGMQVHGGISFTWEHPAHLYFRRAKAGQQLFGDPRSHRELLAQRLGLREIA
ncbi:MAG: putative acyl-CoA dehydrogenase [Frankiales bacterium]|nr:putative acyl-CoA dehydrogenase [Frankiales bacterium]